MFTGLMPAMVTPFDEREEVDLGVTEAVVERFIEAGVDGISPLGSTGEAWFESSSGGSLPHNFAAKRGSCRILA
jgi:dihydrodipicolinate synthase/N-acetylneuraminate lyase